MENTSTRPSFLIYKKFYKPIKYLSDEDKGKLFKAIFEYQTQDFDGPEQVIEPQIHMAFEFFKNQFELDNKKWEKRVEANRTNGKKGGRPKNSVEDDATDEKPSEPNETNRFINNPIKTKKGEKEIEIEKQLQQLDPATERYRMLVAARHFNASWISMGAELTQLKEGAAYREWE